MKLNFLFFLIKRGLKNFRKRTEYRAKFQKKNKSRESRHFKQFEESTYYRLNRFSLKRNTHAALKLTKLHEYK